MQARCTTSNAGINQSESINPPTLDKPQTHVEDDGGCGEKVAVDGGEAVGADDGRN